MDQQPAKRQKLGVLSSVEVPPKHTVFRALENAVETTRPVKRLKTGCQVYPSDNKLGKCSYIC